MVTEYKSKRKGQQFLTRENSKAVLNDYTPSTEHQNTFPSFSLEEAEKVIFSDPVVNGAEKQFIDKCSQGRYFFVRRDKPSQVDSSLHRRMEEEFHFSSNVLRAIYRQAFRYRNAFLEVRRGEGTGRVVGLNVLNAKYIKPIVEHNGDPVRYRWTVPNPHTNSFPEWSTDEVIWLKFYENAEGFAPIDMESIYNWVRLKEFVRKYVSWLWDTGQYRTIYNFKQPRKEQVDDALAFMKQHEEDPTTPFLFEGELDLKQNRDMEENASLLELLKYIDQQILVNLRVPPIDAGIPDATGRSNADAQGNNFLTSVHGIKSVVLDGINNRLLDRMNRMDAKMVFAPSDRFEKKQIIDELNLFANMGLSKEALTEYMTSNGLLFETDTLWEIDNQENSTDNSSDDNPKEEDDESVVDEKDNDLAPSRFNTDHQEVQSHGSGEDSTTREEQLLSRQYPHLLDWVVPENEN